MAKKTFKEFVVINETETPEDAEVLSNVSWLVNVANDLKFSAEDSISGGNGFSKQEAKKVDQLFNKIFTDMKKLKRIVRK